MQNRTLKQLPYNPDGTFGTALMTVSVDQETWTDVAGVSRMTKKIQGFGSSAPRTTQYSYFSSPADSYTYGRLKWQSNPDASFEYYIYSGFDATSSSGTIIKYTPAHNYKWTPGATAPDPAQCQIETTVLGGSSSDVSTTLDGVVIDHRSESVTYDVASSTSILTEKNYTAGSAALTTVTGYYYDATFTADQSNKIKWRELPDGTAEAYTYSANGSGTTDTILTGEGNRSGVTRGSKIVKTRNRRGEVIQEAVYFLNGGGASPIKMSEWIANYT
ncbi:MAG: hypothetical protein JWO82_1952, partial [Akkermansiaceae bacterium]|nr:hypothetical protein [Akkermansiaceae bacterium]